jgi:hypothetical protein
VVFNRIGSQILTGNFQTRDSKVTATVIKARIAVEDAPERCAEFAKGCRHVKLAVNDGTPTQDAKSFGLC